MVVIYTGNNEIDKILESEIKGSMVVSYSDFIIEDNKFENQIVILGINAIEGDVREYLYLLRSMNIRIILILKNEKQKETKIALENGIYDLIFGNFYSSQVKELIDNPKQFKDIADLYKKIFDIKVSRKKIKRKGE